MNIDLIHLLHQAFFGGIAAAGFGILFNFSLREAPLCFLSGAFTLGIRTLCLDSGWNLESASLVAALSVATICATVLYRFLGCASSMVALAGCIPMVPGAFFAQAILGFFSITSSGYPDGDPSLLSSLQYLLRVTFTVAAIGTGLTIPSHIFRKRDL
jgi:uncharacterized membrane protein YjjB (DUF3815 family)